MKATLEFNLPEENSEFETCNNAGKYHSALYEFSMFLRNKLKHSELLKDEIKIYEEIQKELYDILNSLEIADV